MDARTQKEIIMLSEAAGALALHAVAEHTLGALSKAYLLGVEAGRLAGIEEGRASAASLIAGLRQLLGNVEGGADPMATTGRATGGLVPAGLGSMLTNDHVLDPITAGRIAEAGRQVVGADDFKGHPLMASIPPGLAKDPAAGEKITLNTSTGEIKTSPEELAAELDEAGTGDPVATESEKLLKAHPGINFPGYFPLDAPVNDCALCEGLGTIPGELYGEPCLVPCSCEAGKRVEIIAGLMVDESGELADQVLAGALATAKGEGAEVEDFPEVREPGTAVTEEGEKPAQVVEEDPAELIVCGNVNCEFFNDAIPGKCEVPVDKRGGNPLNACPEFLAPEPDESDGKPRYECCRLCSLPDPDCHACGLVDKEIDERNAAERKTAAPPAEVEKCGNGSCTATGRDAKEVCLLIQGKECGNFLPLADCKHEPSKRFNAEDGSLMCGVCGKLIQASRKATQEGANPEPKGEPKAEAEPSPNDQKMKALQESCKHPAPFIEAKPDGSETCQLCLKVLTAPTLPLPFEEKATPNASTYFTPGEELDQEPREECDHLPEEVRFFDQELGKTLCGLCGEEVPEEKLACEHPEGSVFPAPDMKNGEVVGYIRKCGECGEIVARLDANRQPIPREQWPETGGELDAAAIRKHGYKPSELKMIKAGFSLIRYDRDDKNLYRTCNNPALGRFLVLHGKTYADCERRLAEELKDPKLVQVDADGFAADRHAEARLRGAGFEFYRKERGSEGVTPKIKQGSKNWGMHSKYKSDAELEIAWKKLLDEDPLALQG